MVLLINYQIQLTELFSNNKSPPKLSVKTFLNSFFHQILMPLCRNVNMENLQNTKPTVEEVIKVLEKQGIQITREQAAEVLSFMKVFAKIVLKHNFEQF